jgi:hypothetical protein
MEPMKAVKASRVGRRALLLTGIGVLAAGSVAGVSVALTSSSSGSAAPAVATSATKSSSATIARPRERALQVLRRAVHGDVEIATKNGFVTFEFDRGTVTSISTSAITVLRPDSQSVTESVSGTTRMPKPGVPAKGQNFVVISTGGKALYIFDVGAFHGAQTGSSTSTGSGLSAIS